MSYMSHTYREEDFGWGEMPDYSDTARGMAMNAEFERNMENEREDYYRYAE